MSILQLVNFQLYVIGDGTTTEFVVDLATDPISIGPLSGFVFPVGFDMSRYPQPKQLMSVNCSPSLGINGSLSGNQLTLSFDTAPSTSVVTISGQLGF